jgi:hypothetical protein
MRKSGLRDKPAGGSQNAAGFRAVDLKGHVSILERYNAKCASVLATNERESTRMRTSLPAFASIRGKGCDIIRVIGEAVQRAQPQIGGLGEAVFCHATPRSDTEIFTRLTAEG